MQWLMVIGLWLLGMFQVSLLKSIFSKLFSYQQKWKRRRLKCQERGNGWQCREERREKQEVRKARKKPCCNPCKSFNCLGGLFLKKVDLWSSFKRPHWLLFTSYVWREELASDFKGECLKATPLPTGLSLILSSMWHIKKTNGKHLELAILTN